jgi:menaquinone-dependent protoporphyrinogen oxidase
MRVLVTAASKHGATNEIADRIGAVLAAHGVEVDVKKLQEVSGLGGYQAVVLGSGIYLGKWLKEARRFVVVHAAELAQHPTWLFASGSIVGDPPVADDPNAVAAALVEQLVETTHAREHKLFARKLDMSKLGFAEKASVRMAHASERDYRDWQAIDDWAAAIAQQLQQGRVGTGSPDARD